LGEKAATNEVINKLLHLLGSTNYSVRISACQALGEIGEKAETNEVINSLLALLDDTDGSVRSRACQVLEKMGEEAATDEVINRLSLLLGDTDGWVRIRARDALGNMGKKAATDEVINRLLILLGNTDDLVRRRTNEALQEMGEKAVTNEVIKRLVILLSDSNYSIGRSACEALRNMREKAAINKVCTVLSDARWGDELGMGDMVGERSRKIFYSFPCMLSLEEDIDEGKIESHSSECWFLENRFPEEFMRVFLSTKHLFWLPIITRLSMDEGYGITVTKNTVVLHGSKEPVELPFSDGEVGERLRNYFFNWLDKSLGRCERDGSTGWPSSTSKLKNIYLLLFYLTIVLSIYLSMYFFLVS
jgi:hypothetical protein